MNKELEIQKFAIEYFKARNLEWGTDYEIIYNADGSPYVDLIMDRTEGYVYFLRHGDAIKIGMTKNIDSRIKQIYPVMPYELEIVHVIKTNHPRELEKQYHDLFKNKRLNGEWFQLDKEDIFNIKLTKKSTRYV